MDCYVFNWIQWVFIRGRSLRTIIIIHIFMYHFHRWCKNVVGFKTLVTHSAVSHVLLLCSQLHDLASSVIYYWTDVQQYGTFLFICYLCVVKEGCLSFCHHHGFKKKKSPVCCSQRSCPRLCGIKNSYSPQYHCLHLPPLYWIIVKYCQINLYCCICVDVESSNNTAICFFNSAFYRRYKA